MNPLYLIEAGAAISALSGLPALLIPKRPNFAQRASTSLVILAAALGLAGAFAGLFSPASVSYILPWQALGGSLVGLDPLSSFFLVPVFLVGALASIYGLGYWPQARNRRSAGSLELFFGLMTSGMALLLIARHALAFLLGWEAMALSAFFLITAEDSKPECRRSGLVYLVATHLGTLALFAMFALWRSATGSFDLEPAASMGGPAMAGIFGLALLGFGLKAGMMPLHFWLPGAHAAAPSHVSAMLSGVVLKMGVYGIVRMLSLMPTPPASWGAILLALGAISGLFGVAYALAQHDMKKLLAYHSVENIGIILMGLGVATLGASFGRPELVVLGLSGCLLHVWNHSLFKSLLFFGAGSVLRATGTRQIDKLGGLGKPMPFTAALFIVGAVAICGLPPLNGFVSELCVYLGLFGGLVSGGTALALASLAAPVLAMIGALAAACFVKVCGAAFLGSPRSSEAERATESPASMIAPMAVLAAACAFIGLAPKLVAPALDAAIGACGYGVSSLAVAAVPAGASAAALPALCDLAPLAYVGWGGITLLALCALIYFAVSRRRARRTVTWDCGYGAPTARMQYTASSFARSIVRSFGWALRPSPEPAKVQGYFPKSVEVESEVEDAVLEGALMPAYGVLARLSRWFHRFQAGLTQQYVLYILLALIALLIVTIIPFLGTAGL